MTENHQDCMYKSTLTEKQGRRIKNHYHEEICKCFLPPFVKLHHHPCPVVMKPCPIHGNLFQNIKKGEKDRKQNVIISFHPSSKTEKLLQPIKTLLANCNSDTKINFQYYSPSNSASKESLKPPTSANAFENLKKTLNSNILVEKTKSFVADKTNKVKKLRQCFHSPCNSIAQKTRSHTSVQEKLNQILREEAEQTRKFYNMVPEIPPADKKSDPGLKWLYSNGLDFKNQVCEKVAYKKRESDFMTVTQRDKNNVVNHKIFEIKHKKDLNDVPFVGFPKEQTQFVYSSVFGGAHSAEYATYQQYGPTKQKQLNNANPTSQEGEKFGRQIDGVDSSEKSHRSSSSGSVYITPFIFLPKTANDNETEIKIIREEDAVLSNTGKQSKMTQTPSTHSGQSVNRMTQTALSKRTATRTISTFYTSDEEPKCISVLIQTDSYCFEKSPKRSKNLKSLRIRNCKQPQKTLEEVGDGKVFVRRDYEVHKPKQSKRKDSKRTTKNADVQTGCCCPQKEILVTTRWDARDQTCQTEDSWNICLSVKTFESKSNKSQMTYSPSFSQKAIQTSVSPYSEGSDFVNYETPESIDRDYQNLSYIIKPLDEEDSDQTIEKIMPWWKKSHSDGDLYDKTKNENLSTAENRPFLSSDYESKSNETAETVKGINFKTKETSTKDFPSAVSDLSELRRFIQEIFEKGGFGSAKTCDCDATKMRKAKVDRETMTENYLLRSEKKMVNAEVQTIRSPKPEKVNVQAQTNVHVLLDEAQQNLGQKINLRRSVTVDHLNDSKTYYVCAVCGGEIKTLLRDISTSTDNAPIDHVKKTEKTTEVESAYTKTVQVRMVKNCQCRTDKNLPELDKRNKSITKQRNQEKSNIPVPLPSHIESVNFKTIENGDAIIQLESRSVHQRAPEKSNNQGEEEDKATNGGYGKPKSSKKQSKSDIYQSQSKTEDQEVQNNRSRRRNTDFIFPVFITPFWTKELMQTWQSVENPLTDNDSDNYSKSPVLKQKRSYEKYEPTETAAGKKVKMELDESSREYVTFCSKSTSRIRENSAKKNKGGGVLLVPVSSDSHLKNESVARVDSGKLDKSATDSIPFRNLVQMERFSRNGPNPFFKIQNSENKGYYVQFWPEYISQKSNALEEESSVSIDEVFEEEIPQRLPRENSFENEEESNEECGQFSDNNYTPRTERTYVFENESSEENQMWNSITKN